jgi:hypothetical protein
MTLAIKGRRLCSRNLPQEVADRIKTRDIAELVVETVT